MLNFVTPNDSDIMSDSDSRSINNAVKAAKERGIDRVVIPRINERTGKAKWDIDEAIILPSDIEIVLDNCYLRQMDGTFDNVFRNFEDPATPSGLKDETRNIVIRGVGCATIDGGEVNGLTEHNHNKDGLPHIEKNNVMRFYNLRGLKLSGFTILNQRWWAINLHFVEEAEISSLVILTKPTGLNQDGIDLRAGCHNIIIHDIFGQSGDDFIALTGLWGTKESAKYDVLGKSHDIHDIVIKNIVATSTECAVIALRVQDGIKLYNITIDTVYDTVSSEALSDKSPRFDFGFDANSYKEARSPYATVRVGQHLYIHLKQCAPGDVSGLHVTNIHSRTNNAIMLNESVSNSYFGNIYAADGVDRVITTRATRDAQESGCNLKNVVFENIFYDARENEDSHGFDFISSQAEHTMENVVIRNAFLGRAKKALNMQHKGKLRIDGLYYDDPSAEISIASCAEVTIDGKAIEPNI